MKKIRSACPLDCWDACAFLVGVKDGKAVSLEGDKDHPITQGFICSKGRKHLSRVYHVDRITAPLQKVEGRWQKISWNQALDLIAQNLQKVKKEYGTTAVLRYSDCGSGGLLKELDELFFHLYGGVSEPKGSLCWAPGIAAQSADFGIPRSHHPHDLVNAKTIILWGRNVLETNIHLLPFLKEAQKKGSILLAIDPIVTPTAKFCDYHYNPSPGTDGFLALGMARRIKEKGYADEIFLQNYTEGLSEYERLIEEYTMEKTAKVTGITEEKIEQLVDFYAQERPAAILLGYGLQRYGNSGQAIRAIDALGAVTGNIGKAGGGVSYANFITTLYCDFTHLTGNCTGEERYFPISRLADFLEQADNPAVKTLFITRSNPLTQVPDTSRLLRAWRKIPFKVVVDMFMTDTAKEADLILPCTSFLEEENITFSSMWQGYISYSKQAIAPLGEAKSEYEIFQLLAQRMNLRGFPEETVEEILSKVWQPIADKFGLTLSMLKEKSYCLPQFKEIPWAEKDFATLSGKYQLLTDEQLALPFTYQEKMPINQFYFLTPHCKDSLNSQHFLQEEILPLAYLSSAKAKILGLAAGDKIKVSNERGSLICLVNLDKEMRDEVLMVYQGYGEKHGGAVNNLTPSAVADFALGTTCYDCLCVVEKVKENGN